MSALETQVLLKENKIDFTGNYEWPGSSLNLNNYENLEAIMEEKLKASNYTRMT